MMTMTLNPSDLEESFQERKGNPEITTSTINLLAKVNDIGSHLPRKIFIAFNKVRYTI